MKSLLSSVLTAEQCARCGFCCSFAAFESWETPLFSAADLGHITALRGPFPVKKAGTSSFTLSLDSWWQEHGEASYAPCPFLDKERGCMLSDEEKPFDCKIWPLRIMRRRGSLVIALTPTCREINKIPEERMKRLVAEEGAGDEIFREAGMMPDIIKDYREGFPVLMERKEQR